MYVGVEVETESAGDYSGKGPAASSGAVLSLLPKHAKQVENLRPNTKVTITIRGVVQEVEQQAQDGSAGVGANVTMTIAEFTASRGSEFEELLDNDE